MLDVIKFVEAQPPSKDLRLQPWDLHPLSLFFPFPLGWVFCSVELARASSVRGCLALCICVPVLPNHVCANAYHAHTWKPLSINVDKYGNMLELWHAGYQYR
jgi:hypothetical protein